METGPLGATAEPVTSHTLDNSNLCDCSECRYTRSRDRATLKNEMRRLTPLADYKEEGVYMVYTIHDTGHAVPIIGFWEREAALAIAKKVKGAVTFMPFIADFRQRGNDE